MPELTPLKSPPHEPYPQYRQWETPRAHSCALLIHGLGAHSGRWEYLAGRLAAEGIGSFAIELRGFGESSAPEGDIDSFRTYRNDLLRLLSIMTKEPGKERIYVIAESMGALLALSLAAELPPQCRGLVCMAPAFKSRLPFSWSARAGFVLSCLFNPQQRFQLPIKSAECTRDPLLRAHMDQDPREKRSVSARQLREVLRLQRYAAACGPALPVPVLFQLAGDDRIIDSAAARRFFSRQSWPDKELIEYPQMAHVLAIDQGKERVADDLIGWIRRHR